MQTHLRISRHMYAFAIGIQAGKYDIWRLFPSHHRTPYCPPFFVSVFAHTGFPRRRLHHNYVVHAPAPLLQACLLPSHVQRWTGGGAPGAFRRSACECCQAVCRKSDMVCWRPRAVRCTGCRECALLDTGICDLEEGRTVRSVEDRARHAKRKLARARKNTAQFTDGDVGET